MRGKVLIVDDSEFHRILARSILEDMGELEILEANDGYEAVEVASKHQPDLILMDAVMPRMSGFDACLRLKTDPSTSFIPVIFVTSKKSGDDIDLAFASGAADYVAKPFDGAGLRSKLAQHLDLA